MATRHDPRPASSLDEAPRSFPVTQVIGEVTIDRDSDLTAHEAAFLLIARHDTPGDFHFPLSDGRTCEVTVAYT
jgi:hypothetical protein